VSEKKLLGHSMAIIDCTCPFYICLWHQCLTYWRCLQWWLQTPQWEIIFHWPRGWDAIVLLRNSLRW